jgi:hypothetical protein
LETVEHHMKKTVSEAVTRIDAQQTFLNLPGPERQKEMQGRDQQQATG